ncbi:Protein SUPPRESSOR OF FRI 4 [Porphyridium purpureum]|uniref:Protein SUPPRESSOR OF FRI 4 n=1 Tax=Porphyridium purpureum TaxID=35688 RepID=A0A5J4Z3X8_PORPP|nr:Protein SUPPRESSOR OF FRI 4 [Porphyridium purpureum]|eukprot:POR7143..scf295_1
MGRKRKRAREVAEVADEEPEDRIFCYYCKRDFIDEQVLLAHQAQKHFRCATCGKRLASVKGLCVHSETLHRIVLKEVPNAIQGRKNIDSGVQVQGMQGIPKSARKTCSDTELRLPKSVSTCSTKQKDASKAQQLVNAFDSVGQQTPSQPFYVPTDHAAMLHPTSAGDTVVGSGIHLPHMMPYTVPYGHASVPLQFPMYHWHPPAAGIGYSNGIAGGASAHGVNSGGLSHSGLLQFYDGSSGTDTARAVSAISSLPAGGPETRSRLASPAPPVAASVPADSMVQLYTDNFESMEEKRTRQYYLPRILVRRCGSLNIRNFLVADFTCQEAATFSLATTQMHTPSGSSLRSPERKVRRF